MKTKMPREERKTIPRRRGDDLVTLPDEIITDILLRLPVKSLSRFKCVCTSWLSLISDPQFVKSHLQRGSPTVKILTAPPFQSLDCQLLDETRAEDAVADLGMPAMMPKMRPRIWGSCDGLVAFRNDGYMILWNPTTRMFRRLPSLRTAVQERDRIYGIGYDSRSDDYKVIIGFLPKDMDSTHELNHELTVKVFSLKTNAWRERRHRVSFTVSPRHKAGVFMRDAVHWIAKQLLDIHSIVSMNLADESIGEVVPLPDLGRQHSWRDVLGLAVLQSRLALHVHDYRQFEVWIMNEYAVKSSWTKLFVISLDALGWKMSDIALLAILRSGKIIVPLYATEVVMLEPQSLTAVMLPIGTAAGHWFSAVAYTETLVSPPGFQHIPEV